MQIAFPHLLAQGLALVRRYWPLVIWAYVINLLFGLLAGVPLSGGLAPLLDHAIAAQKLAGTIDLTTLTELALQLRAAHLFPIAFSLAMRLNLLQVVVLFVIFAATIFLYLSGESSQLTLSLRGAMSYLWRVVRGSFLAGAISGLILGILLAARSALLAQLEEVYTGRTVFTYAALTGAAIFIVALVLRVWFDLVEIHIVRLSQVGELRARRALLPAYRFLLSHFLRLMGGFTLAGLAGTGLLGLCVLLWKALPAHLVWLAVFLGQVGLFLLLVTRFWQRGFEAALVLATDPLVAAAAEIPETVPQEQTPFVPQVAAASTLAEPTLRELVQKLQTDPLARAPEGSPAPTPSIPPTAIPTPIPTPSPTPVPQGTPNPVAILLGEEELADSPVSRHATKFPLGGTSSSEPPPQPDKAAGSAKAAQSETEPPE